MKCAYLMAIIDVRRVPPAVVEVRVLSDNEKTIALDVGKFRAARIAFEARDTFDEAKREIERQVATTLGLAWVQPLMRGRVAG